MVARGVGGTVAERDIAPDGCRADDRTACRGQSVLEGEGELGDGVEIDGHNPAKLFECIFIIAGRPRVSSNRIRCLQLRLPQIDAHYRDI